MLKVLGMKPFVFAAALVPSVLVALLAAPAAHADELPTLPAPTATSVAPAEAPEAPAPTPSAPEAAPASAPAASAPTLVERETAPKKRRVETEEAPREWYGYQTLLVDVAGIGMGVGAAGGGYPLAIAARSSGTSVPMRTSAGGPWSTLTRSAQWLWPAYGARPVSTS